MNTRVTWISACLILAVVFSCLVATAGVAGWFYRAQIWAVLGPVLGIPPATPGAVTGVNSVTVTSTQSGSVTTSSGARVDIPAGAVPPKDDGSPGTMVFSIEEDSTQTAVLGGSFSPFGSVYRLGPEGFTFAMPVRLTLPIPQGTDVARVIGLVFFDGVSNSWQAIPGSVDFQARTVSVETIHFSRWTGFYLSESEVSASLKQWFAQRGGWFTIINPDDEYWYGVCVETYTFDNPQDAATWLPPTNWILVQEAKGTTRSSLERWWEEVWFPAGQYTLSEYISRQVVTPTHQLPDSWWRPLGTYTLKPNKTIEFTNRVPASTVDGVTQQGRPPCWGASTTSVGTGDVQITLTWQANADIDLHVVDPNGDEVYYENPRVPSGGELDRDNECSNFIMGQPENIYWPSGQAPSGTYKISVVYYGDCGGAGPVAWTVRAIVMGQVYTYTGTLNAPGDQQEVATFTVP